MFTNDVIQIYWRPNQIPVLDQIITVDKVEWPNQNEDLKPNKLRRDLKPEVHKGFPSNLMELELICKKEKD